MPLVDDCIGKWIDSPSKSFRVRNSWVSDLSSRNEATGTTTSLSWAPSSLIWNHRVLFHNLRSLQETSLWGLNCDSLPIRKGQILGFFVQFWGCSPSTYKQMALEQQVSMHKARFCGCAVLQRAQNKVKPDWKLSLPSNASHNSRVKSVSV